MRSGRTRELLNRKLSEGEKLHFTLIDPDASDIDFVKRVAASMSAAGTDAFLIGGSTGVTPHEIDLVAKTLKESSDKPVIIFPGNVNCLTPYADAVFFMVLMNSLEPYYLIEAQVQAAPIVKKYGLETIPLAYLVVYGDSAVAHVGRAYPLPPEKPELAVSYAMAAEMLGFEYLYLEAGSGAKQMVPTSFVRGIKKHTRLKLIVGGGIRSAEGVLSLLDAGADIIVTGTLVEREPEEATKIVKTIKSWKH
ncbi:MAG: geranylgeranylglyceryl/heptaprenylglyceryl phosphate synthase [Desulfurococcaceae archaeon]